MTAQNIILNRLLDKYENSKHFSEPGTSNRRIMLRIAKGDLPEYNYEDAEIRDLYNAAAQKLETGNMVQLEWVKGRPLLSNIVLNLEQVNLCYKLLGKVHPKTQAEHISLLINNKLKDVTVPWIDSWRKDVCHAADVDFKIPSFCKDGEKALQDLLRTFQEYNELSNSITMRAFSNKCFSDTKYFERNVRDLFLRIARKYNNELAMVCEENNLGEKEQLAFLGIYARPELYEIAGNCLIHTKQGILDLNSAGQCGLALPSTLIESIIEVDTHTISKITFIENKTNYDEYIMSEQQLDELVIYHGGFMSPQKRRLFSTITKDVSACTTIQFWADIDFGGFRMFQQLQELIPELKPMRMSAEFIEAFHLCGLVRSNEYLNLLKREMDNGKFPLFEASIRKILEYGVTIEQEVFLK